MSQTAEATQAELDAMQVKLAAEVIDRAKSGHAPRWGVGNATAYLNDISGCLAGGVCPTKLLGNSTPAQWTQAIKDAESRLTYCDPEMDVFEFEHDLKRTGKKLTEGSVMDFSAIISTVKQDRDGDILVSKGASVDNKAPLLWQHMAFEPIGIVRESRVQAKKITGKMSIIDSPLGRDAAQLVEFGALRISHGFRVFEFEPMDNEERGFKITKFEIMEVSLVSVPSNTDAVITAFSAEKLHHPMVKQWAGAKFSARPVQVPGADLEVTPAIKTTTTNTKKVGDCEESTTVIVEPIGIVAPKATAKNDCSCDVKADASTEDKIGLLDVLFERAFTAEEFALIESGDFEKLIKGGRALSKANEKQLRDALDMIKRITENDDATPSIKTLAVGAVAKIENVIKAVDPEESEASASELFAKAFIALDGDVSTINTWLGVLETSKSQLLAHQFDEELEEMLN